MPTAEAKLFRLIAEYTYDWETWVDASGRARWLNSAVERMTGFAVAECLADPEYPLSLVHADDRGIAARAFAEAARGLSGNDVEFRVTERTGKTRWVAMSWQPVRGPAGEDLGYRTSIRDIDARKQMEDELHAMRRRAEEALRARSALLANVSHELRSPVHCIAGFAELLSERPLGAVERRYLTLIQDQCDSMLHQVEDLLGLAAMEAEGVGLKPRAFDLVELVGRLVDAYEPRTRDRPVVLAASAQVSSAHRVGDALRLRQVIRNLVDNALKFTERGSVTVQVREGVGDEVVVEVVDTGPGMHTSDIARMFEPFVQGDDATTRRHGGVGLGLSIAQRLVRAMQGTLEVESERARGTTMRVRLPLPVAHAPVSQPPRPTSNARYPLRVLVVDDSAAARELLEAMLQRFGAEPTQAASGEEARRIAALAPFDLVLLDYQMPGADGAETGVALRRILDARLETQKTPVYLLTANVFARDALARSSAAFAGILEKPLAQADLERLLRSTAGARPHVATPVTEDALLDERVVADLRASTGRDGVPLLARFAPRVLGELSEGLARLDRAAGQDELARALHALAGSALGIGARGLGKLLRRAEDAARGGDRAALDALLGRAPELLAETRAALS
jgi:two-component system, sensor histidine kinase